MNRIIASIYTPRKQDAASSAPRDEDGDDDIDGSEFSLGPKRTPIASRRNTPARPTPRTSTPRTSTPAKTTALRSTPAKSTPAKTSSNIVVNIPAPTIDHDGGDTMEVDDASGEADDEEYTFKGFINHRWVENSIEIEVEWDNGETTWEPEVNLHQDAPDALFAYWREQGGRPTNPFDPEMFEVFAIISHNKSRKRFRVEWVGYPPDEATWVSEKALEETAADVITAYRDSQEAKKKKK
ncbi:hypothetical protein PT974_03211 [Cladobotryum mycophilum]|uniref:Chromo domain-containing protein n=1 Tax=Cladobotryum mycophilum TaxID=491253 RepID=A0ABR0SRN2_9HYPO